jgi:hypothetical protein
MDAHAEKGGQAKGGDRKQVSCLNFHLQIFPPVSPASEHLHHFPMGRQTSKLTTKLHDLIKCLGTGEIYLLKASKMLSAS